MCLSLIGKMNFNTNHTLLRVNISKFTAKDLCAYVPDGIVNNRFKKWYCDNIDHGITHHTFAQSRMRDSCSTSNVRLEAAWGPLDIQKRAWYWEVPTRAHYARRLLRNVKINM